MAKIFTPPAGPFRAIIRTKHKTLTRTFEPRMHAKAWAVRTEGGCRPHGCHQHQRRRHNLLQTG